MEQQKIFFMPLNCGDYLSKTAHLTPLEDGMYNRLRIHYWMNECTFPSDMARLKPGHQRSHSGVNSPGLYRACGAHTPEEVEAVNTVLAQFFPQVDDKHVHEDLDREYNRVKNSHLALSENGKMGAEARWGRGQKANAGADSHANGGAIGHPNGTYTQTKTQNKGFKTPTPLAVDNVDKKQTQQESGFDKGRAGSDVLWDVRHKITDHTREVLKGIARGKDMDFDYLMNIYNQGMIVNGGHRREIPKMPDKAVIEWCRSYSGAVR